jgi:hypothetical protein
MGERECVCDRRVGQSRTDSGTSPVRIHAGACEGGSDAFACILEEEEEEEEVPVA